MGFWDSLFGGSDQKDDSGYVGSEDNKSYHTDKNDHYEGDSSGGAYQPYIDHDTDQPKTVIIGEATNTHHSDSGTNSRGETLKAHDVDHNIPKNEDGRTKQGW